MQALVTYLIRDNSVRYANDVASRLELGVEGSNEIVSRSQAGSVNGEDQEFPRGRIDRNGKCEGSCCAQTKQKWSSNESITGSANLGKRAFDSSTIKARLVPEKDIMGLLAGSRHSTWP